jgi:hypothetical protein
MASVVPGIFEEQARNIQELMGHRAIKITAIDNHGLHRCPDGIARPLGSL